MNVSKKKILQMKTNKKYWKNILTMLKQGIAISDDAIDFNEDPDITNEDFKTSKLIWNIKAS